MKIVVLTDFDSVGSGYKHICAPLLTELSKMGHEIKVAGLLYRGEEHRYPFSIIPAQDPQEGAGIVMNLCELWHPDVIVVALDLPIHAKMIEQFAKYKKKYIAIVPLENPPLCIPWAAPLFNADKVFFISELGKREALKVGLTHVEHLQVGVDTVLWHPATSEEKSHIRKGMGIPDDAFVVLTVADNQERKNLWAGLKAVSLLKKETTRPIRYLLVTRENNPYGWKLRDLIRTLDLNEEVIIFERGMPQKDLWGLYAMSDVYLQPSKAEGLGLPVMDAMACGVPVVATDTGAMHELLQDGRGFLVPAEYSIVDVWGNSKRDFINIDFTKDYLKELADLRGEEFECCQTDALSYARSRTWDIPAKQFDTVLKELFK